VTASLAVERAAPDNVRFELATVDSVRCNSDSLAPDALQFVQVIRCCACVPRETVSPPNCSSVVARNTCQAQTRETWQCKSFFVRQAVLETIVVEIIF